MATTEDKNVIFEDFMGIFQMDTTAVEAAFKNIASFNEKFATVSLQLCAKMPILRTNGQLIDFPNWRNRQSQSQSRAG